MFKNFVKKLKQTNLSRVIVFVVMLIYAITMLYSVVWVVLASLKEHEELLLYNMNGLPVDWLFDNYLKAFEYFGDNNTSFVGMFINSIWFSVGSALLSGFVTSISAYIFSKYEFRGKKIIFAIFMIAMLLPMYGNFPATYKLVQDLNLYNSPLYIIVGAAGYGNTMLIMMGSFEVLSWEYAEAAEIDGANYYYIFFNIMFPLVRPAFIALTLVGIIGAWNNYMTPIIYLPDMPTLAAGLYIFKDRMQYSMNLPAYFSGVVLSFIPTLVLFIIFRETIMENVAVGGIKG